MLRPLGCAGDVVGGAVGSAASAGWDAVAQSSANGAVKMLEFFAKSFSGFPTVDFGNEGVRSVYAMCLGIAAVIAVLTMLVQTARTAFTGDGNPVSQAFVGLGKALIAFMTTLAVASAAVVASDEVTDAIVRIGFGDSAGLRDKLTKVFAFRPDITGTLLLVLGVLGILLVLALWVELLLRNAALTLLIAVSPIAAVGQMSDTTKGWWAKTVSAAIQLTILKPVIAVAFVIGLKLFGQADALGSLLTGMTTLTLAVAAWWLIARFMPFTSVTAGSGGGLAAMVGFGSNATNRGGGPAQGVDPDQFSQAAEARTMAAHSSRAGASAGKAGAAAGASGASGSGAAAGAGAAGAATGGAAVAAFAVKAGLDGAQKTVNSMANRSEQMAGHAGLDGQPHANPAGYPRHASPQWPGHHNTPPVHADEFSPDDDGGDLRADPAPPPVRRNEPGPVRHQRAAPSSPVEEQRSWDQ
ncbi:hypothetical protein [Pilimelia anulata]|uniref:hypothetical protein n=1 Tax=Pilimelia anulata TaxID=53371 RepID=UPI001664E2F6|nr:hypothetical protein [Pilimelia anulata]